jgi:flagellar basal body rod protein FlgF
VKILPTLCALILLAQIVSADDQAAGRLTLYNELIDDLLHFTTIGYKALGPFGSDRDLEAQGALIVTDRPFNLAILGKGYFCYRSAETNALYYSRSGRLHVRADGFLANEASDAIQPAVVIPPGTAWGSLSINRSGEILAHLSDQGRVHCGKVRIYLPKDFKDVDATDGVVFHFKDAKVVDGERAEIISGCLETSTVAVVEVFKRCLSLLEQLRAEGVVAEQKAERNKTWIVQCLERLSQRESLGKAQIFETLRIETTTPSGAP